LCYTFGTVSTGCFSPKNESIAGYSPFIQYIMVLFMFLSGLSYLIYYLIITGKLRSVIKNEEIRIYSIIILFATIFITGILYFKTGRRFETAFRECILHVSSYVSTSGYSNSEYSLWPYYILPLLYLLLFIGGCIGSGCGGIKMSRFLILFRNFTVLFKNLNSPTRVFKVKYNRSSIDEGTNISILTFILVFGMVFMLGTISLSVFGTDLKKSAFLSISALSTFGHNLSLSHFPNMGKVILILLMLIGKLEIYPFLLMLIPSFYRNRNNTTKRESA